MNHAARLAPYLHSSERIVWADHERRSLLRRLGLPPRTPLGLGLVALATALLGAGAWLWCARRAVTQAQ